MRISLSSDGDLDQSVQYGDTVGATLLVGVVVVQIAGMFFYLFLALMRRKSSVSLLSLPGSGKSALMCNLDLILPEKNLL